MPGGKGGRQRRGSGNGPRKPSLGGKGGARRSATTVKTARGRRLSSTRWLQRHLNDPYVAAADRSGYRSRAAFKLIELDDRFGLLRPGRRVVDLGAAPGGWTQVAVQRVGADDGKGVVVALDQLEMEPVTGAAVLCGDFFDERAVDDLRAALGGSADVVLSDLSPSTTGHGPTDHLRIVGLVEAVLDFAEQVLAPGGALVAKVFQGGADQELLVRVKRLFAKVKHAKPPASRKESSEQYLVATGFRGTGKD